MKQPHFNFTDIVKTVTGHTKKIMANQKPTANILKQVTCGSFILSFKSCAREFQDFFSSIILG